MYMPFTKKIMIKYLFFIFICISNTNIFCTIEYKQIKKWPNCLKCPLWFGFFLWFKCVSKLQWPRVSKFIQKVLKKIFKVLFQNSCKQSKTLPSGATEFFGWKWVKKVNVNEYMKLWGKGGLGALRGFITPFPGILADRKRTLKNSMQLHDFP